jgi:hypothetical protein
MESNLAGANNKRIWKARLPLKIKIFLWQLNYDAILTRENMRKRNWPGCPNCSFCDNVEMAKHLFFSCGVAKVVWGAVGACRRKNMS